MPRIRNIVKHITVEIANEPRKCHRNPAHGIKEGEAHLAVYDAAVRQNICGRCTDTVLGVAREHLEWVRGEIGRRGRG